MGEKGTVVIITILFSILMIMLFYIKPFIAPNVARNNYKLGVMVFIGILNLFVMKAHNALTPIYIFGPIETSFLFILATVALFIGPIVQNILITQTEEKRATSILEYWKTMIKQKIEYFPYLDVIIAPFIEEFLYRYCNGNLWISAGISDAFTIFCSPLIFGLAHFHHFFEDKSRFGWKHLLIQCLIQVGFTSLFGFWAQFCWVKTHGLLTCVILHGFCNYMQFPDFEEAFNWPNIKEKRKLLTSYISGILIFSVITLILAKI